MRPSDVLTQWINCFNRADSDGLAALYDETAVNHQTPDSPVEGRAAIRAMFARDFAVAEMVCIPENIFEDGGNGRFWNGAIRKGCAVAGSFIFRTARSCFSGAIGTS